MKHPSLDQLERLAELSVDREELGELAWHLYRCDPCRRRLSESPSRGAAFLEALFRELGPSGGEVVGGPRYRAVFDTARRSTVMRSAAAEIEKRAAGEAVGALAALEPEERRERLLHEARFHTWAVAERLLEVYRRHAHDEPREAEPWARLALDVVHALRARRDPLRPGDELISDLEARTLAHLAGCLRVQSRFREADRVIVEAESALERGTGDQVELATVLEAKASLRRAQRRFADALGLTERAGRLYRRLGESSRLARTLINKSTLESYLDRRQRAIATLRRALSMLDPVAEPELWTSATYNLATALHEAGRAAEAVEKLAAVRPHLEATAGAVDRARFRWFEGVVARDASEPAAAERVFGEARDEFVRLGMAYEVALVSLDLAALYLDQGRSAETRRLAESMLPIFRSRDIHREATAALLLFHRAALAETATATLAAEVAAKVRRGQARGARRADEQPS